MSDKKKGNKNSLKINKNKFGREDWQIYSFLIPAATLIIIFKYLPMWGIVLSFQNFRSGSSIRFCL
jgi:ABC-type polysaccharide transport system permease subunit